MVRRLLNSKEAETLAAVKPTRGSLVKGQKKRTRATETAAAADEEPPAIPYRKRVLLGVMQTVPCQNQVPIAKAVALTKFYLLSDKDKQGHRHALAIAQIAAPPGSFVPGRAVTTADVEKRTRVSGVAQTAYMMEPVSAIYS